MPRGISPVNEILLLALLGAGVFLFVLFLYRRSARQMPGAVIWQDDGVSTASLYNATYGVAGKPDWLCDIGRNNVAAVEYKHRKKGFFESDIVQLKCAALAARGQGYTVTRALLRNRTSKKWVRLPADDEKLYQSIKRHVENVRDAKEGRSLKANSASAKCSHCSVRKSCLKRAR